MMYKKYLIPTIISAIIALFYIKNKKGGVKDMALCYAILIINGYKTFKEVPASQKEKTRQYLVQLDAEELAVE